MGKPIKGIRETGSNTYRIKINYRAPDGTRKQAVKVVHGTLAQAIATRDQLHAQHVKIGASNTVSGYALRWIQLQQARLAPKTLIHYTGTLATICADLGGDQLHALTRDQLQQWQTNCTQRVKPVTANGYLRVLRTMLQSAVYDGLLQHNVAATIRALPETRGSGARHRSLTLAELACIFDAIDSGVICAQRGRAIKLLALTGMRRGEVLGLHWSSVTDQVIVVQHSATGNTIKSTKSGNARLVPISDTIRTILSAQRASQPAHFRLVFGRNRPLLMTTSEKLSATGEYVADIPQVPTYLDKAIRKLWTQSKMQPWSTHALRRTYEDTLRQLGVSDSIRRAVAGWESPQIQRVYQLPTAAELTRAIPDIGHSLKSLTEGITESTE